MYGAGRGRMREILGQYTQTPPGELRFAYGASGKPTLTYPAPSFAFNLSHTGAIAALAVAPVDALGLDIEALRPLKEDIARRYFSPAEVAALEAHPPAARTAAFYRCWTRKEAFVKATGDGLGFPLDAFDVSIDATNPPRLLRLAGTSASALANWQLAHIGPDALPPDVVGAIAVKTADPGTGVTIRVRH